MTPMSAGTPTIENLNPKPLNPKPSTIPPLFALTPTGSYIGCRAHDLLVEAHCLGFIWYFMPLGFRQDFRFF